MNHERSFLTLKELKKKVYDIIESGYISFQTNLNLLSSEVIFDLKALK